MAGNYVQPFTIDERLAHARQAAKQLGASIPWIVDAMDNRLKHALGDRPTSEFIIDPRGKIVRKRAWSNPQTVRKDLEELIGKVDKITKEEDIKLKLQPALKAPAKRGLIKRLPRPRMQALQMEPQVDPKGSPFYAKLRAEADAGLIGTGTGKVYLGFHLDPFLQGHWNNLTPPLRLTLDLPKGAKIGKTEIESPKVSFGSDADPREFMLDVDLWPEDKPLKLTVTYSACVEGTCHVVKQQYLIHRRRDKDGGGARGAGAGFWEGEQFAKQMLARDKNDDGKLDKGEVMGLIAPHFAHFDANKDGLLELDELKRVADWLNKHHQPGAMPKKRK